MTWYPRLLTHTPLTWHTQTLKPSTSSNSLFFPPFLLNYTPSSSHTTHTLIQTLCLIPLPRQLSYSALTSRYLVTHRQFLNALHSIHFNQNRTSPKPIAVALPHNTPSNSPKTIFILSLEALRVITLTLGFPQLPRFTLAPLKLHKTYESDVKCRCYC